MNIIREDIANKIARLPDLTVINIKSFDLLLNENIVLLKEVLGRDWQPLESDPYMKNLRVLTLRQMHNQADRNWTIRNLLITTATGSDLDHLGVQEGVYRDKGERPYALFEFKISTKLDHTVIIPKGTILNSADDIYKAETMEVGRIFAGDESVTVRTELQALSSNSDIRTDGILTDLPFVASVKQLENFINGSELESDDRYRVRILMRMASYSTAGAEDAYIYYTLLGDNRIDDVVVINVQEEGYTDLFERLDVPIIISSRNGVDQVMIDRVYASCTPRYVRPLNDHVIVRGAIERKVRIKATVEMFDLLRAGDVEMQIKKNFESAFYIGQNLVRSDVVRKMHIDGVYKVISGFEDVIIDRTEIIVIDGFDLDFVEARDV